MPSQDVINWTRHQISQRKSLKEICEDIMSRCLSPDSDVAGGIGCDNMTVLVVAILNGRTVDEWYDWVADRVDKKVGHDTPRTYENLYPPPRIGLGMSGSHFGGRGGDGTSTFGGPNSEPPSFLSPSWLQRLNRPLYLSQAGISSILPVSSSSASFDDSGDEFEDDDSDEEMVNGAWDHSFKNGGNVGNASSLHAPPARDSTASLRAQLEAMDRRDQDEEMGSSEDGNRDGDGQMHLEEEEDEEEVYHPLNPRPPMIIGAPVIPSPQSLADLGSQSRSPKNLADGSLHHEASPPRPLTDEEKAPIVQARAKPRGDVLSGAVKVEGLIDTSDSPTKM
jgi:protein phosphatase 2C family protein 2/3